MQLHLDEISSQLPANTHAVIVADGAKWHTTPKLTIPSNITLLQLPACSPELNPAEKPWQYLKDNFLSHHIWQTVDDIITATAYAWNTLLAESGRVKSLTAFSAYSFS